MIAVVVWTIDSGVPRKSVENTAVMGGYYLR